MIDYNSNQIVTKADILNAATEMAEKIELFYGKISDADFYSTAFGGWSAVQNFQHIVTVNGLVNVALLLPKWTTKIIPNGKEQKSFPVWKEYYLNREKPINAGPLQPGKIISPKDSAFFRASLAEKWRESIASFQEKVLDYSEKDLNECNFIHPDFDIGVIALREMLFIILIHWIHHTRNVERKFEKAGKPIAV